MGILAIIANTIPGIGGAPAGEVLIAEDDFIHTIGGSVEDLQTVTNGRQSATTNGSAAFDWITEPNSLVADDLQVVDSGDYAYSGLGSAGDYLDLSSISGSITKMTCDFKYTGAVKSNVGMGFSFRNDNTGSYGNRWYADIDTDASNLILTLAIADNSLGTWGTVQATTSVALTGSIAAYYNAVLTDDGTTMTLDASDVQANGIVTHDDATYAGNKYCGIHGKNTGTDYFQNLLVYKT